MNADALHRFIDARAVRLPLPFDGAALDVAHLKPLDARLARADFVALGELNHFIHEKSDFRLFCARWLASRGWTDFAEELGWSDGWRVDRYLRNGGEMRLPSFDDLSHLRSDRDDKPGGILKSDTYPVAAFVAEQKRFYSGLRAASDGRARLAGIDIDALPGGSYADIRSMLDEGGLSAEASAFLRAVTRVKGETATQEAARLRAAHHLISPDWPPEIAAALDALAESLDYIAMTYTAQTYDAVRPGMAFRERAMQRRLLAAQHLMNAKRLILLGHALHLAKRDDAVTSGGVGPGGGREPSLGHWLVQARKANMLSIWLMYGAGEDCQPLASLPRRADFPPDTLNALLRRYEVPLLFFPADAAELFGRPLRIGQMYNAVFEAVLTEQADAVVYLPTVTPLRAA